MDWVDSIFLVVYLQWCFFITCASSVPEPPSNLTLTRIFESAVVVMWDADNKDDIVQFEMTVRPLGPGTYIADVAKDLDGQERAYLIQSLSPATEYQLFMFSRNANGVSNVSDVLTFRTLEEDPDSYTGRLDVHPGEVVVVAFVLIAWMCAVGLFLHKWGKIRIIQSAESRFNHCPKNLHTIKVVKRPTDSVIYKNYTKEVSTTMIARQKRFERMHTMPNIKVKAEDILAAKEESTKSDKDQDLKNKKKQQKFKAFSRTITSPVIELDEAKTSTA